MHYMLLFHSSILLRECLFVFVFILCSARSYFTQPSSATPFSSEEYLIMRCFRLIRYQPLFQYIFSKQVHLPFILPINVTFPDITPTVLRIFSAHVSKYLSCRNLISCEESWIDVQTLSGLHWNHITQQMNWSLPCFWSEQYNKNFYFTCCLSYTNQWPYLYFPLKNLLASVLYEK